MTEDHVDPDWDGIMGRLDGQPSPDELREAREAGARAMMDMLLNVSMRSRCGVSGKSIRDIGFRIMALAYLANHPLTHQIRNLEDLAKRCGVNSSTAHRSIASITAKVGILKAIPGKRRPHKR